MDTHQRLLVKAITWQGCGCIVMLGIGWGFTGSFSTGGGIAIAGAVAGFCAYFFHELAWARITWGRRLQNER